MVQISHLGWNEMAFGLRPYIEGLASNSAFVLGLGAQESDLVRGTLTALNPDE